MRNITIKWRKLVINFIITKLLQQIKALQVDIDGVRFYEIEDIIQHIQKYQETINQF